MPVVKSKEQWSNFEPVWSVTFQNKKKKKKEKKKQLFEGLVQYQLKQEGAVEQFR